MPEDPATSQPQMGDQAAQQPSGGFMSPETATEQQSSGFVHSPNQINPIHASVTPDHQLPPTGTPDPVSTEPQSVPEPSFAQDTTWNDPLAQASTAQTWSSPTVQNTTQQPSSSSPTGMQSENQDLPVPVVKVLSVRGLEYALMTFLLWFSAGSLITIILSLINGVDGFTVLAFPLALLIVSFPGLVYLFLRLRTSELRDPKLRIEPSKRRWSQLTQILAFLTCLFNLVAFVYAVLQFIGGEEVSIGKSFGGLLVVLLIAGGVFMYYWKDEHKVARWY